MMIIGMNKKIFKQLCMNYNKEPDKELYELWKNNLRCYDENEIKQTINYIISNDKYFPNINRMLEIAKAIVKKENSYINEEQKKQKIEKINIIPDWYYRNDL